MKKLILTLSTLALGVNIGLAMSSKPADVAPNKQQPQSKQCKHNNKQPHKLVDIYSSDSKDSNALGVITFKNQNDYNIFYCKESNWCEVVNKEDGKTGWVDLAQLKESQEKYAKYMHTKNTVKRLEAYTKIQDQKIAQLNAMMMQMQKEFSYVLQQQQAQINQLKQGSYY